MELYRSGPGPEFYLVVILGVSIAPVLMTSWKPSPRISGLFHAGVERGGA